MSDSEFVREYVRPTRVVVAPAKQAAGTGAGPYILFHGNQPGLVLDFGRELHGSLDVRVGRVTGPATARIRFRLGESVSEALKSTYVNQTHAVGPGVRIEPREPGYETGFRFARFDLLDSGAVVELAEVQAQCVHRDMPIRGAFRCPDERLNRIWEVGAYTAKLCAQSQIWDGIKRGRNLWAGDLAVAAPVVRAAFGQQSVITDSLDDLRDMTWSGAGEPDWMNGIPAYSLWWLLALRDEFLSSDNLGYLKQQRKYLVALTGALVGRIATDGREELEGWRYLDWATRDDPAAVHAGYQALMVLGLRAAAELCGFLDEEATRGRCLEAVTLLFRHRPGPSTSRQANALLVLAGLSEPASATIPTERVALRGLTPFLGPTVLDAALLAGDARGALWLLGEFWGAMLDLGATTFWEDFDLSWAENAAGIDAVVPEGRDDIHGDFGRSGNSGFRMSLCHAWSAGPTAWLSRHVLAFRPVKPGCEVVEVRPILGDLQWAEGTVPTPRGNLRVRHHREADGTVASTIDAPAGVTIVR